LTQPATTTPKRLSGDRPTAIFAVNDNNAIGVMATAHAPGLRVPDDLSLVGYNDIPVVSRLPLPLTTIRCPSRTSPPTHWNSSAKPATTAHPAASSPLPPLSRSSRLSLAHLERADPMPARASHLAGRGSWTRSRGRLGAVKFPV
jgi:hypothetical protein